MSINLTRTMVMVLVQKHSVLEVNSLADDLLIPSVMPEPDQWLDLLGDLQESVDIDEEDLDKCSTLGDLIKLVHERLTCQGAQIDLHYSTVLKAWVALVCDEEKIFDIQLGITAEQAKKRARQALQEKPWADPSLEHSFAHYLDENPL